MKKILGAIAATLLILSTSSWASFVEYNSGELSGSTLLKSDDWKNASISWEVDQGSGDDAGKWQYTYSLSGTPNGNGKKAEFINIETLKGFNIAENLLSWEATPSMTGPTLTSENWLSWSLVAAGNSIYLSFITNTAPMWGNIYVGGQNSNYAKNANTNSVLVPTPIPAAAWMLGAGLIGLVAIRRKGLIR